MGRKGLTIWGIRSAAMIGAWACFACDGDKGPALSIENEVDLKPDLGAISEASPQLGVLGSRVPVHEAVDTESKVIGWLSAGAKVPRSEKFVENQDCIGGWYSVAPAGYVCTEKAATTDIGHPTLSAMALRPNLNQSLPYVYARTTKVTGLFKRAERKGVELSGRVPRSTVMAIVGSWTAPDESHEPQRLGLRTDGLFIRAVDLKASPGSEFRGVSVGEGGVSLPYAFVVRKNVHRYTLKGGRTKRAALKFHEKLPLTGRFRTLKDKRFYALGKDEWVRHEDVTVVQPRSRFPDWATEGQRWVDISIITGTMTAYEGKTPVYTTLVSVGRDRLGDPEQTASTPQGVFTAASKRITRHEDSGDAPLLDSPWAIEVDGGFWLVASPRHDRFGIEHTDGDVELSPKDGRWLFDWAGPSLPTGFHGITFDDEHSLRVVVRR